MEKLLARRRLEKAASVGLTVLFAAGGIADVSTGFRTGIISGRMGAKIHWADSPFIFAFVMCVVTLATLFFSFCLGAFIWDVTHSDERNWKIDAYLEARTIARQRR